MVKTQPTLHKLSISLFLQLSEMSSVGPLLDTRIVKYSGICGKCETIITERFIETVINFLQYTSIFLTHQLRVDTAQY